MANTKRRMKKEKTRWIVSKIREINTYSVVLQEELNVFKLSAGLRKKERKKNEL